jgi:hypothetical protein
VLWTAACITSSRLPALSLFFPGGCPNNRHRRTLTVPIAGRADGRPVSNAGILAAILRRQVFTRHPFALLSPAPAHHRVLEQLPVAKRAAIKVDPSGQLHAFDYDKGGLVDREVLKCLLAITVTGLGSGRQAEPKRVDRRAPWRQPERAQIPVVIGDCGSRRQAERPEARRLGQGASRKLAVDYENPFALGADDRVDIDRFGEATPFDLSGPQARHLYRVAAHAAQLPDLRGAVGLANRRHQIRVSRQRALHQPAIPEKRHPIPRLAGNVVDHCRRGERAGCPPFEAVAPADDVAAIPTVLSGTGSVSANDNGYPVPIATIDSMFDQLPALRLLKADVEGMETEILTGARETIAKHRPFLYVENERPDSSERLLGIMRRRCEHKRVPRAYSARRSQESVQQQVALIGGIGRRQRVQHHISHFHRRFPFVWRAVVDRQLHGLPPLRSAGPRE